VLVQISPKCTWAGTPAWRSALCSRAWPGGWWSCEK